MLGVASITGVAGSQVKIPVILSDHPQVSGLQFKLTFDPSVLAPVPTRPVTLGSLVPGDFSLSVNAANAGQIVIVISPPIQDSIPHFNFGSGSAAQIIFQTASAVASGTKLSLLTLSDVAASDSNGNAVAIRAENGVFSITDLRRGDVNQDGAINVQDVIRLIQHLNGQRPLTGDVLLAADLNADGKVDLQDLIRLVQHITGEKALSSSSPAEIPSLSRIVTVDPIFFSDGTVSLPIMITDGTGIAAAKLAIEYYPDQMRLDEPTTATLGDLVPEGFQAHANTDQSGRIIVVLSPPIVSPVPALLPGSGTLFSLRLTPQGEACRSSFRVAYAEFVDSQGRSLPATVVP